MSTIISLEINQKKIEIPKTNTRPKDAIVINDLMTKDDESWWNYNRYFICDEDCEISAYATPANNEVFKLFLNSNEKVDGVTYWREVQASYSNGLATDCAVSGRFKKGVKVYVLYKGATPQNFRIRKTPLCY